MRVKSCHKSPFCRGGIRQRRKTLGARLRGRTATKRSKKGAEKVSEKVLGKVFLFQIVSENGGPFSVGFTVKKGSEKGF